MPFNPEIAEELNVLALFNSETTQEGVKIHSSARVEVIAAAERLYKKELITQVDGGYLTELGRAAASHSEDLLSIIRS
ncbi:MAG: TIGR02647 family protein [Immundisolibacteraceae bacterium]|nr:TIGR02647 family protein [Immundisolibacteraceae bacterium]